MNTSCSVLEWACVIGIGLVFFHFDLISPLFDHYFLVGWTVGSLLR